MGLITEILITVGKYYNRNDSLVKHPEIDFSEECGGRWIEDNKGNLIWEDVPSKIPYLMPYYVNAIQEDEYTIVLHVGFEKMDGAIECMECETEKDVDNAVKFMRASYEVRFNIETIDKVTG